MGTKKVSLRPNYRSDPDPAADSQPTLFEDAALIARIKRGETEVYGDLVRRYQDRVFNTCWRICGHLEDARDLTQEAFLRAYERISEFREQSGFYTWIFRIAVNLSLSHRRLASRRRAVSLDDSMAASGTQAQQLAEQVAGQSGHESAEPASDAALQGQVAHALLGLEPDYRAVVVLRDIEGMDYQMVSHILNIPVGTVKSRLFRARTALRHSLGGPSQRDATEQ